MAHPAYVDLVFEFLKSARSTVDVTSAQLYLDGTPPSVFQDDRVFSQTVESFAFKSCSMVSAVVKVDMLRANDFSRFRTRSGLRGGQLNQ